MNKKVLYKTVFLSWYWTSLSLLGMALALSLVGFGVKKFVSPAIVISGVGGFLIFSMLIFIFSELLINLFMGGKVAHKEDYPNFVNVAEELFKKKKMWINPRLYILNMPVPNAMAYGMGIPGFSAIAITPQLYELLNKKQLKGVVAHELAHIKCKDVGILTTIGLMTGSIEKLHKLFLSGKTALGKGPFAFVFAGMLWFVSRVIFGFLRAAISQERELAADALGSSYVGSVEPLVQALTKLSATSESSKAYVLSDLMVSHPGMDERIESLRNLEKE